MLPPGACGEHMKRHLTGDAPLKLTELGVLDQAAEQLRVLAHAHRLRMVQMLLQDLYTVGELARACKIPSHMASEHLRLMQHCGLLTSIKEGRKVYYQVADSHVAALMSVIEDWAT